MKFRLGDILLWRSTNLYDALGENTIMLKGFHAGIVLIGRSFEPLSSCGKSPSNTYVTFLVDKIFPIEEVVGHIWYRPNGASLYHIKRKNGRDIPEKEAYSLVKDYFRLDKLHFTHTIYLAVAAYFKMGGVIEGPIRYGKRYNLCSTLIAHFLFQFRILRDDAIVTNLLPMDFYDLNFYQKDEYERVEIFDKQTHTYRWLFLSMLERLGKIEFKPMYNTAVGEIIKDYDYPQDPEIPPHIRKKYYRYLAKDTLE